MEAGGFEDVPALAGKHAFIQHHALITLLPIQGYKLDTAFPELCGVRIGAREAEAEGVNAHEVLLVVCEDLGGELFIVFGEDFFREAVDVVWNFACPGEKRFWVAGWEVVGAAVCSQPCERSDYFAFFGLGLFGGGGEGLEFCVGAVGGGGGGDACGMAWGGGGGGYDGFGGNVFRLW